ncbi:MAG: type IV pilus assembly protein PilM [Planctomycetota bacterium]
MFQGKSVVGLDIGNSAVKAIELTKSGQSYRVTGYAQIDFPSGEMEAKISAVSQLMKEAGFRSKKVSTNISGKTVIIRYLNMVAMDDGELRNAIRFEAEKFVPVSLDECVLDCQRLEGIDGDSPSESNVVLVAAEKSLLNQQIAIVQKAGYTPEVIDVDAFAIGNAYKLFVEQAGDIDGSSLGAMAFVDVGATKTTVNIMVSSCPVFTREIYLGGADMTASIARQLGLDEPHAEALKRCPGDKFEEVQNAVFPTLDDLGNELQLSFDYFEGQNNASIERVFVSGGASRMSFFCESLSKICEKPVEVFNPFTGIQVDDDIDQELLVSAGTQFVVAVGLAARMGQ